MPNPSAISAEALTKASPSLPDSVLPTTDITVLRTPCGPFTLVSYTYRPIPSPLPAQVSTIEIGRTLFDAGTWLALEALQKQHTPQDFDQIVLTHHHEDHIALAAQWQSDGWDGETYAPRLCMPMLNNQDVPLYRRLFWGHARSVAVSKPLEWGTQIVLEGRQFDVVHTPGHTPTHASYVHETTEGTYIISGDIYLTQAPNKVFYESDLGGWIQALDRLLAYPDPLILLPAHGSIDHNSREALETLKAHLLTIIHDVNQAAKSLGTTHCGTIAHALYKYDANKFDPTDGQISSACLVRGVLDPVLSLPAAVPDSVTSE